MGRVIKFETDVPAILSLKFAEGKTVPSKFGKGDRVQFSTMDDGVFWLDPEPAHDIIRAIREQNIKVGEEFKLTKRATSHGGSRFVVEPAVSPRHDAGGYNVPSRAPHNYTQEPPPPMRPRATAPQQQPEGTMSWEDFSRSQDAAPPPATEPARTVTPAATRLMACYMAAIDTMTEAQAYATRKGMAIAFTGEDVRSTAISLWISDCKGGR